MSMSSRGGRRCATLKAFGMIAGCIAVVVAAAFLLAEAPFSCALLVLALVAPVAWMSDEAISTGRPSLPVLFLAFVSFVGTGFTFFSFHDFPSDHSGMEVMLFADNVFCFMVGLVSAVALASVFHVFLVLREGFEKGCSVSDKLTTTSGS